MIITPQDLKEKYLFGIDILITTPSGEVPLPDDTFVMHIEAAQERVSKILDLTLEEKEFAEDHDYYVSDYRNWGFINLYHRPIKEVKKLNLQFGPAYCFEMPKEWIIVRGEKATIQIFPTSGTIGNMLVTGAGNWIPLLFRRWEYAPQMWHVEYIAGYSPGECPRDIIDVVAKEACIGIAEGFMDLVIGTGVGSQSISVDGVSQSSTRLIEHPRIKQYREDVKNFYDKLYSYYRGLDFEVG